MASLGRSLTLKPLASPRIFDLRQINNTSAATLRPSIASDSRKRLALAIVDFLQSSLKDGTLQAEDADSIEIASNCIAECFHVDPTDEAAMKEALGGQNLLAIYGVYEKLKGKSTASTEGDSSANEGRPSTPSVPKEGEKGGPTADSERLKGQGNAAMQKKDYQGAIDAYTKALEIAPLNPIYLSNRAAAYSGASQHELAKNDAELATAADPKYTKAWSRLGLARFALGDAKGSMEAYKSGIDAEGNGGSDAMKKGYETAKRRVEEESGAGAAAEADNEAAATRSAPGGGGAGGAGGMPDLGGLASMLGGGGGGGGGMPDLGALMQNPMMRQMAQNLMSNPDMMNNLMNNPQLRNMANNMRGGGGGGQGGQGGGMPDMSAMMNDPAIAEM
ncbi:hypothetical protein D0865_14447 [Hortaea werneckii]|uniref:SGTA homodimerisation domain-containing protein n=1 Tax=Hortaea werneckii TaxID=91943 RepID=A0A3M7B1T3_HORWE|nr:hypothetical protein D0865_14447 [Hortaea werneckii]